MHVLEASDLAPGRILDLEIPGAFLFRGQEYKDERGSVDERLPPAIVDRISDLGFGFRQANVARSEAGVLRGIHVSHPLWAQAKYVTCLAGSVIDLLVDLRPESESFGHWVAMRLSEAAAACVWIPPGVGHAFFAESRAVVTYLMTREYQQGYDVAVDAFDIKLDIDWPRNIEFIRSERDQNAMSLAAFEELYRQP